MNFLTGPRSRYSLKVEGDAEELEDGFSSATRASPALREAVADNANSSPQNITPNPGMFE